MARGQGRYSTSRTEFGEEGGDGEGGREYLTTDKMNTRVDVCVRVCM